MCEAAEAAARQPRGPPALVLPGRQMRLAETRWPWPMAASSDSQAVPALALVASSALVAAMAVSSAQVAARPAAYWLVVQPSSSDRRPPECRLTQRAAASLRHSQRGAVPTAVPAKMQLADAAASHAPATPGLAGLARVASCARGANAPCVAQVSPDRVVAVCSISSCVPLDFNGKLRQTRWRTRRDRRVGAGGQVRLISLSWCCGRVSESTVGRAHMR
eukprot:scaffold44766_cov64-Phaeocystis_antarctica.AAC.10